MGELDRVWPSKLKERKEEEQAEEDPFELIDGEIIKEAQRKIREVKVNEIRTKALESEMDLKKKQAEFEEWKREQRMTKLKGIETVRAREYEPGKEPEEPLTAEEEWSLSEKLSKVEEDRRQVMIDTIRALRRKGSQGDDLLPLLLSLNKQYPDSKTNDFESMTKSIGSLFETFKKFAPEQDPAKGVEAVVEKVMEKYAPAPGGGGGGKNEMERMSEFMENFGSMAEKLGWSKPGALSDELTKFTLEHELKKQELGDKKDIEMAKLRVEGEKGEAVTGGFLRLAKVIGMAIAEGEGEVTQTQKQVTPAAAQRGPVRVVKMACPECNANLLIPNPDVAREFACKACGNTLNYSPKD